MKTKDGSAAGSAARFNARAITDTIKRALASAGLGNSSGQVNGITATIENALSSAGLMQREPAPRTEAHTIDGTAREVDEQPADASIAIGRSLADSTEPISEPTSEVAARRPGEFLERSFAGTTGVRTYKVYVPAQHLAASSDPMPMVVMLHGCTQTPDDFAAGTQMNELADEHGFVVVYPAQSASANRQKCWNWFLVEDQQRDSGEPGIIAGITREVASMYRIDGRRIFVAGMSAGAAMAVILGATYPEIYAAVGAHSGLGYGAAHDLPSAFGAMRGGRGLAKSMRHVTTVPTIVFHGDGDHTVDASNAIAIVEQATARHGRATLRMDVRIGTTPSGRTYRRTDYIDASDRIMAEHWTLHGAGHAWSGGSTAGSFTDPLGPDASREMIRFFYSLPRSGTA